MALDNTDYLCGFGNTHQTEAIPNTLPHKQNSPQKVPADLYAEQISGSAFTAPRHHNLKSWVYKIAPSVMHSEFNLLKNPYISDSIFQESLTPPNQYRWAPLDYPKNKINFIEGLIPWAFNGSAKSHIGAAIYLYAINNSMRDQFFYNADGELLIVPEQGTLKFLTEFGELIVAPNEIIVIPRGVRFQIILGDNETKARGYVLENYGSPLGLPELGPIGANGLAHPRHFLYPRAKYFDEIGDFCLITKFQNNLWQAEIERNPLNVVAWHGNYAPYKYNLSLFNTINSVSFDHPDPSIFTVLTSQTTKPGTANVDFVIFPPRWMVAEHTFRPPYYHRNIMSEFMGLIHGKYDAKSSEFSPGGSSLHNTMSAHGPGKDAYILATERALIPESYEETMAFMFESNVPWNLTKFALKAKNLDKNYINEWKDLPIKFSV